MQSGRIGVLRFATMAAILLCPPVGSLTAQQQAGGRRFAGTWVGSVEVAGKFQPVSMTFTDGDHPAGTISSLFSGSTPVALSAVTVVGSLVTVRLGDQSLTGTLERDAITGDAATTGGRKGTFRLIRAAELDRQALSRFIGAYQFRDGHMLLVDLLPGANRLYAVDARSGQARAAFPVSSTEFVCGPALLVPYPTEQTLLFQNSRDEAAVVVRGSAGAPGERAVRANIHEEQVRFQNGAVTLAGTLLLPRDGARHPGLVFAHGSGATPREWFWGFGYLMASRGFAVLAFDKRGAGESSGDWRTASFEDLAADVAAGAKYLQTRNEVDPRQIGFWGLSQGAWIAPLAAVRFPAAAFVVALSGGGLTPAQQELADSEYEMRAAGFSNEEVREALAFQTAKNDFMRTGAGWEDYFDRRTRAKPKPWYGLAGTDLSGPAAADDKSWSRLRQFYFYDPSPTLRGLHTPLLAIFGELDSPDGVKANVAAMSAALQGGEARFTTKIFPNGRHNLMDVGGFEHGEYARLRRFVPGLFDTMVDWLETQVRR